MFGRLSKFFLVVTLIVASGFLLAKIKVPHGNSIGKLTALLPLEKNAASNVGVYFWAENAVKSPAKAVQTGSELLGNIGAANIRITMSAKSDMDYKAGSCIPNFSLKGLAQRQDFQSILANPDFKTIMITAIDGVSFPDCSTKNYLNPDFYTEENTLKIQQEYSDFASYLGTFSDKTFIISNWEGDNDIYCGAAFGATASSCPNYQQSLEGFQKWINARTAGIRASGASNVFSAVEFNIVRDLENRGLPSVLYNVIPSVDADYFSYSSYESINALYSGDNGDQLKTDVGTIRDVLSSAGKNSDNLIIGEYGFDQGSREEIKNKLAIVTQTIAGLGIKYAFVWNLLDTGGPFGLYDQSSALTPAGKYFCDIFNGSACGPEFTISNVTKQTRNPGFWTVDSWRLELKGAPPNAELKICGEQDGNSLGCTPVGDLGFGAASTTDSGGNWVLENSWAGFDDKSIVGAWKEWMEIGNVKSAGIQFTVSSPDLKKPSDQFLVPDSERDVETKISGLGSGEKFSQQLHADGGIPPYSWEIIGGELPQGWVLSPDGILSGEISKASFNFIKSALAAAGDGVRVRVTDSNDPASLAVADITTGTIAVAGGNPSGGVSGGLVPCGRTGQPACTTCDLFVLASNIINFILFTLTPAIAVLFYLLAGFMVLLGGANPGLVATGNSIFKTTTYGLFIIFGSWMITNSVLKSIAGDSLFTKDWNKVTCTNPTSSGGGGGGVASSGFSGFGGGGFGGGGASGGWDLACTFNGVDYATFNLCTGQNRPGGCGTSSCSGYSTSISNYANGAATAQLLKTMMVIESDCNISAATGSSFGLMQMQPSTANMFADKCGVPAGSVTSSWLTNPANADKSICLAAAFVNSIAGGTCGSQPKNIYAGYNAGTGNCADSSSCAGQQSCDGRNMKKWECPYDDTAHTVCNTGFYQTKQGATYVNYCLNNLGF